MLTKNVKFKGRRTAGSFLALPHYILNHPDCANLTPRATKLLLDIATQYNGINNGDLCVAFSVMKKRGWKSKSLLQCAIKELLKSDLIRLTRQGGRKIPNLYAITWQSIDECNGKLDISSTKLAPRSFKL
jgi:hypothetical protein